MGKKKKKAKAPLRFLYETVELTYFDLSLLVIFSLGLGALIFLLNSSSGAILIALMILAILSKVLGYFREEEEP